MCCFKRAMIFILGIALYLSDVESSITAANLNDELQSDCYDTRWNDVRFVDFKEAAYCNNLNTAQFLYVGQKMVLLNVWPRLCQSCFPPSISSSHYTSTDQLERRKIEQYIKWLSKAGSDFILLKWALFVQKGQIWGRNRWMYFFHFQFLSTAQTW